jgi:FkbM family methyltransferase
MKSHVLPNGLAVNHTNALETINLYQDIFVLKCYLQHGITLPENSVVIDGGANIGMFSLFVLENCPTASIHAFEPAPKTFEVLKANLSSRGKTVVNNSGLGSHSTQELFTYMPGATTASGYYDEQMIVQMKERVRETMLADPQKSRSYKGPLGEELLNLHLSESLKGQVVTSQVRSISDYIDEKGISIINLLKLDVECRERAVLSGIRDEHWPMIQQAVIEVHTRLDDPMPEVLSIFEKRRFSVAYEPEEGMLTTMVYARRIQQS